MLVLIVTIPFTGISQVRDTTKNILTPTVNDSIEADPEDEEFITTTTYDDSLLKLVPAYNIYCEWDTVNIHPYRTTVSQFTDTVKIQMIYDKNCDYVHPFYGHKTSDFSFRWHRFHYGVDIDLETGSPVSCAFEGKVRIAKKSNSYGNVIIIRHNNGLETIYAHLSEIRVKTDDYVTAGQIIGLGGSTGHSTGSHLHFEVRYKGIAINPNEIIDFNNYCIRKPLLLLTSASLSYLKEAKKKRYGKRYYIVRKKETLYSVAHKNGLRVSTLCRINKISSITRLKPGRRLKLY